MRASAGMTFARYFREAVLIHCFAIASAGIYALISAKWQSEESTALRGVALSAAIVCFVWSLRSAVRSCRKGEPIQPLTVFGVTILLEALIFFCAQLKSEPTQRPTTLLDYVDYYGVSFFAVFAIVTTFIAAPLGWWRVRRQNLKLGHKPHYREVYVRTFKQYGIIAALITVLMLPPFLYYYCAQTATGATDSWRVAYIKTVPEFVRDIFCDTLAVASSARNKSLHLKMIEHRWVSKHHLQKQLTRDPIFRETAIGALLDPNDPASLPLALSVAEKGPSKFMDLAASLIVNHANSDQISDLLKPASACAPRFRGRLIEALASDNRQILPYIGELKVIAYDDDSSRTCAMSALAKHLPEDEFLKTWKEFLGSRDPIVAICAAIAASEDQRDPFPRLLAILNQCSDREAATLLSNNRVHKIYETLDYRVIGKFVAEVEKLRTLGDVKLSKAASDWLSRHNSLVRKFELSTTAAALEELESTAAVPELPDVTPQPEATAPEIPLE